MVRQTSGTSWAAGTTETSTTSARCVRGLVERDRLAAFFDEIEPELFRFPAIDPASFRRRVAEALGP